MMRKQQPLFTSAYVTPLAPTSYSKPCVKWQLSKRPQIGFQDQLLLNAGQKYLQNATILSTFIKLKNVIKSCVLSIFEWSFYIDFTAKR